MEHKRVVVDRIQSDVDVDDDDYVKVEKSDCDLFEKVDSDLEFEKVDADEEYNVAEDGVNKDDDMEDEYEDDDMEDENEDEEDDDEMVYGPMACFTPTLPFFPYLEKEVTINDIVKEVVLPFLPAKAIVRCSSVSKGWDQWIKSPFLAHRQSYLFKRLSGYFCESFGTEHQYLSLDPASGVPMPSLGSFLPEDVRLLSSCNGLILCRGLEVDSPYYVCNPATRDWTGLPSPMLFHGPDAATVLAFEPSPLNIEADYQLLSVIPMFGFVQFEIYSSKTRSWSVSEAILFTGEEDPIMKGNSFYMNGVAYLEMSSNTRKVIAFHLSSGAYEVITLPYQAPTKGVLSQIQGELCYVGVTRPINLKNKYSIKIHAGMKLLLRNTLEVTLGPENLTPVFSVLPCPDGDNVMILVGSDTVYSCSMTDGSVKRVFKFSQGAFAASAKYLPYVNSLVQVAKLY